MEISTPCSQLDARDHGHYTCESEASSPEYDAPVTGSIPLIGYPGGKPKVNSHPNYISTAAGDGSKSKKAFLNIKIEKILVQTLWEDVQINSFSACTGHFVCGSSYALIGTSVDCVKVWKLQKDPDDSTVEFHEWNTLKTKSEGILLQASAAYSGRIACVFKFGKGEHVQDPVKTSWAQSNPATLDERYTCAVTVYECESTGGKNAWIYSWKIFLSLKIFWKLFYRNGVAIGGYDWVENGWWCGRCSLGVGP